MTPGHLPLPLGATCGTPPCGQRRHQPCPGACKVGPPAPDRRPRAGHIGDGPLPPSLLPVPCLCHHTSHGSPLYKAGPFSTTPELCGRPREFESLTISSSSRPPAPSSVTPTCRPLRPAGSRALPSHAGPFPCPRRATSGLRSAAPGPGKDERLCGGTRAKLGSRVSNVE